MPCRAVAFERLEQPDGDCGPERLGGGPRTEERDALTNPIELAVRDGLVFTREVVGEGA